MVEKKELTLEEKEQLLLKPCLTAKEVQLYTGFSRSVVYRLMCECRKNFNGTAGIRTDAITTKSLCLALGTTIEDEMRLLGIAKGYIHL